MPKYVIAHGTVVTLDANNTVFTDGTVAFSGDRITYCGPALDYLPESSDQTLDATGHLVLPGLVNAHTHSAMGLARGLADETHWKVWIRRVGEFFRDTSDEDVRIGSQLTCADLLLSGVTTIADRYGPLDPEARGIVSSGIRAAVTSSIITREAESGKKAARDLLDALGTSGTSRVFATLGPHATDTCDSEVMAWVRREADARGALVHLHVAQCEDEVRVVQSRGYKGSVDYLKAHGLLGPHVIATHCIYVSEAEIGDLAESGTHVCHCPSSNVKVEGRTAATRGLRASGVNLCLGTDCTASNNAMDLIGEMKIACLANKLVEHDPGFMTAAEALRMAVTGGATALGLKDMIGSLERGKKADLIIIHVEQPHCMPWHDPVSMIVYSGSGRDVRHVIVDGEWVVRDRLLTRLDPEKLIWQANRIRKRLDAALAIPR